MKRYAIQVSMIEVDEGGKTLSICRSMKTDLAASHQRIVAAIMLDTCEFAEKELHDEGPTIISPRRKEI